MACSCNYFLFFVLLLIVKTDKHLLLLWLCNCYSFDTMCHDWSTENNRISWKQPFNRKTCNHFLKSRCMLELSWNFLKSKNAQILFSFSKPSGMILKSSHVYKQLDYMVIFYLYLVCFTFSVHNQCSHFILQCTHFRKCINFYLNKKFVTFWFHLFDCE